MELIGEIGRRFIWIILIIIVATTYIIYILQLTLNPNLIVAIIMQVDTTGVNIAIIIVVRVQTVENNAVILLTRMLTMSKIPLVIRRLVLLLLCWIVSGLSFVAKIQLLGDG